LALTTALQDDILDRAAQFVAPDGLLAYATCSILWQENRARVDAFLTRHPGWRCVWDKSFQVDDLGDGFYTAHLTKAE
jgi:16S rRNA (cytosine967-C5)-methyltransferase